MRLYAGHSALRRRCWEWWPSRRKRRRRRRIKRNVMVKADMADMGPMDGYVVEVEIAAGRHSPAGTTTRDTSYGYRALRRSDPGDRRQAAGHLEGRARPSTTSPV